MTEGKKRHKKRNIRGWKSVSYWTKARPQLLSNQQIPQMCFLTLKRLNLKQVCCQILHKYYASIFFREFIDLPFPEHSSLCCIFNLTVLSVLSVLSAFSSRRSNVSEFAYLIDPDLQRESDLKLSCMLFIWKQLLLILMMSSYGMFACPGPVII